MVPEAGTHDRVLATAWPLINRPATDVICHRAGRRVTVTDFLADVAALARRLPVQGHPINLCADRYLTLVGFAAALLRGQATLLNADPAPARLDSLAQRYAGAYVMADQPLAPGLPVIRLDMCDPPTPTDAVVPVPLIPGRQLAAIAFTSGSTGEATAHGKPWGALVAAAVAAAERFGFRPGDGVPASIVATVPPQHMYGFETTIVLPLQASVAICAGASFFPADVLDALAGVPPRRILVTTPLHLRALLAEPRRPLPLAAVVSATAPLSQSIAAAVERDWQAPMLEIYGATEAGSMASRRTVRDADWLAYPGVRVHPGFATVPGLGDVPLADAIEPSVGGRFRLLGRQADLVKLGGRRASLADLNRVLTEIEGVRDGVFVAPPDLERNPAARLTAYVVAPGCSAEAILDALRRRIEPVFLPRPVVLVDALPRNAFGKMPQAALAALGAAPVDDA